MTSASDEKKPITGRRSKEWFEDPLGTDLVQYHRIKGRVYSGKSPFQTVEIVDTGSFGRCLVLDGRIQSCQADEFVYHESLVQPAMVSHQEPKRVLIAGGGEGATSKHVLMHSSVVSLTMVDIDEEVIRVCRERMPELPGGAFDDSRHKLVVGDARKFIEESGEKFDVIILDLPESLEGGPARFLYTREFYQAVRASLNPGGIISSQSDNASWGCMLGFPAIVNTMKSVFPIVRPYQVHIPSFGGAWGFCSASVDVDPLALLPEAIDGRIASRKVTGFKFYDGTTHRHLFSLPRHVRARLGIERRVVTDSEPLEIHVDAV